MAKKPRTPKESKNISVDDTVDMYQGTLEFKDFDVVRDFENESGFGLWEPETKLWIDTASLKSLLYQEDWVYITVDLCCSKISAQKLQVMKTVVEDGKKVLKPAEGHPVQQLLDQPNPYQDYHAWMYSLVTDLVLTGNSIQYKALSSKSLIPVPAEVVGPNIGRDGVVDGYIVTSTEQPALGSGKNKVTKLAPSEVIHIKRPNPSSLFWGLSPFTAGRKAILFSRYTSEYLNNFYLKGASPQLILEMTSEANEKVALRLLKSFEMAYTGRRNQRRTLVTPKGISVKSIGQSLGDQQLIQYVNQNRETILALLKVPKHEVGLQDAGSLGSEEYKIALRNFWSATLIPHMRMIEGELTKALEPVLGEGYSIKFDMTDVDALQEDKFKKAELAEKLLKTHTLNEVRQLYQLNPVDGGDVVGGTAQSPFGLLPSPTPDVSGGANGSEPTIEPPSETQAITLEERSALVKSRHQRAETFIKNNSKWFDKRERLVREAASKSSTAVSEMFVTMNQELASKIANETEKYLSEKASIKDRNTLRKHLEKLFLSWQKDWIKDYMSVLDMMLEVGYSAGLSAPFNLPNRAAIEAIGQRNAGGRREILKERGISMFRNISKTSTEKVMASIERGIKANKTIDEITKDIKASLVDTDSLSGRAETIARTETLTAVSMGQAAAMRDAAEIIPNLKKMWITAGDERVRGNPDGLYPNASDNHYELHGDVVDVDEEFENGLAFPRDPKGEPGQVINCRCAWITLPADQMESVSDNLESEETPQ